MFRRSCLLLPCLLLAFSAFAQRRSGSLPTVPSATELRVRVLLDEQRPSPETRFLVRLTNAGGAPLRETFTDVNGQADFGQVGPGAYRLLVAGPQIENTTAEFQILRDEGSHFEYVHVKLLQSGSGPISPQPSVSAETLKVPDKARKEVEKGTDAVRHGNLQEAEKHYRKATEISPSYSAAENNLGAVCLRVKDYACAREALEKAVEADPHSGHALVNLARLRAAEQNMAQAESLLQRAVAAEPTNPQALTLLAQAELVQHKFPDAVLYARKVHTIPHEGLGVSHLIAAQALEAQGKAQEAAVEYSTFLQEAPNDPMAPRVRSALAQIGQNASGSAPRR